MAPQVFTSVMEQSRTFLSDLIKLAQCNRRKQIPAAPKSTTDKMKSAFQTRNTSGDTSSTEPGDSSPGEFSDNSYQTDGSTRPPPGLCAPPGLEGCNQYSGFNAAAPCFIPGSAVGRTRLVNKPMGSHGKATAMPRHAGSALNVKAPHFQPSFDTGAAAQEPPTNPQQLRQSIGILKGALAEWEASLPEASIAPAPQPTDSLLALQQALTNLSPTDTAALRSFLDCKAAPNNTGAVNRTMQQPWQAAGSQNGVSPEWRSAPQGSTYRPFTPFQGNLTAPWEQARLARVPQKSMLKAETVAEDDEESLATYLKDLAFVDNARVLMVRKINRLGLNSKGPLTEHFSKFGNVTRVMVAPTRSRAQFGQSKARVRPAPLGFVLMGTAEEAAAVLKAGSEQVVQGECLGVFPFSSHSIESAK